MFLYYRNGDTGMFSHWPVFVGGNSHDLAKKYLTDDINKADFIYLQFPKNQNYTDNEYINNIKQLKNENQNIKIIIISKEELFTNSFRILNKLIEENVFTKNEIFAMSSSITNINNKNFTYFPPEFTLQPFLSYERELINFDNLKQIKKSKKIICLSRNHSFYRDFLFKVIYNQNNKELFNSDNLIKYHMYSRHNYNKNDNDLSKIINLIDGEKIHLNDDISHERVFDTNGNYYEEITNEYEMYYFTIVNESLMKDYSLMSDSYEFQISEKIMLPMLTKTIFFSYSHPFYESFLNRIGIKTFEENFGIYYDTDNIENKADSIVRLMKKINAMSYKEIEDIYKSEPIQKKLEYNYELIKFWSNTELAKNEFHKFLKSKI